MSKTYPTNMVLDLLDLRSVKGIKEIRARALRKEGIEDVRDLLYYFPYDYLDRRKIIRIADLQSYVAARSGEKPTIVAEVYRIEGRRSKRTRRLIFILTVRDESGFLPCIWFEGFHWLKDAFQVGELVALSAKPTRDKVGRLQFVHPVFDRLRREEEDEPDWGKLFNTGKIIPKYSSNADLQDVGLDSRGFRTVIRNALQTHLLRVGENLPPSVISRLRLQARPAALRSMHFPDTPADLELARRRIKFEELFYLQLMVAFRRKQLKDESRARNYVVNGPVVAQLLGSLPFQLTPAQQRVVREIRDDLASPHPMNRLLQGDVGSGKTVVALIAALMAIDSGYQVAFMAPTEILAEQHFRTIQSFVAGLPVNVRLLVGAQRKKLREEILGDVRSGRAQIIVGTHALLEEQVAFADLGLVIVDEQHRFGVLQRATLRAKGLAPDVLVMTATPIPRTLAMSLYGDLDVSTIDEMPANRKAVRTAIRTEDDKARIEEFLRNEVHRGRQVYIVLPLIEESGKVDLKAATTEFTRLQDDVFPDLTLGLLHGRMKPEEKDQVMARFKAGAIHILVSTTVIEVGIDVPNASVMVIENAERFGLAQLHQLRGRVGRGSDQSYCILIANYDWFDAHPGMMDPDQVLQEKDNARRRLEIMVRTTDGFRIAEEDLKLRGPGEFFGTQQSGVPELRLARLDEDADLMVLARTEAFALVKSDPHLRESTHQCIRAHFDLKYRDIFDLGSIG